MLKTTVMLDADDKIWLDNEAKSKQISTAHLIRVAVHQYKQTEEKKLSFEELLYKTQGIWTKGDGLKYQRKLRSEWKA